MDPAVNERRLRSVFGEPHSVTIHWRFHCDSSSFPWILEFSSAERLKKVWIHLTCNSCLSFKMPSISVTTKKPCKRSRKFWKRRQTSRLRLHSKLWRWSGSDVRRRAKHLSKTSRRASPTTMQRFKSWLTATENWTNVSHKSWWCST